MTDFEIAPYTAACDDCEYWDDRGRCSLAPKGYTHPDRTDCPPWREANAEPLDFAPVSAVPVAGFAETLPGHFFQIHGDWYYQEGSKPMEYLCSADGRPDTGDFVRRDGSWYYRRDEDAPLEYIGPVDGRAVII